MDCGQLEDHEDGGVRAAFMNPGREDKRVLPSDVYFGLHLRGLDYT